MCVSVCVFPNSTMHERILIRLCVDISWEGFLQRSGFGADESKEGDDLKLMLNRQLFLVKIKVTHRSKRNSY